LSLSLQYLQLWSLWYAVLVSSLSQSQVMSCYPKNIAHFKINPKFDWFQAYKRSSLIAWSRCPFYDQRRVKTADAKTANNEGSLSKEIFQCWTSRITSIVVVVVVVSVVVVVVVVVEMLCNSFACFYLFFSSKTFNIVDT